MIRNFLLVVLFTFFYSCNNVIEVKKDKVSEPKTFVTYQFSPMASLMERMYAESLLLKEQVIHQKGNFVISTDFLKQLETAALTVPSDRDAFFEIELQNFTEVYSALEAQEEITKDAYNAMIQSCLSCHQVKCTGPIERIKKLIIK